VKMGWLRRNLARHSLLELQRVPLDNPPLAAGSFILIRGINSKKGSGRFDCAGNTG